MEETKVLQPGETAVYKMGDVALKLIPLPLGKLKKALDAIKNLNTENLSTMLADYMLAIFDKDQNEFLTNEWIDNNMTVPMAQRIIQDFSMVNGLPNFLQEMPAKKPLAATEVRPVQG